MIKKFYKNKSKLKIFLSWLLVLSIMIFIYNMSSQVASTSKQVSSVITQKVLVIIESFVPDSDLNEDTLHHLIRKNAHFFIYSVLGLLLMNAMRKSSITKRYAVFISFAIGSLYAVADEIHQSFIPGRGPQLTDVLLDSCGVIFGISLYLLINRWRKKK